MDDNKRKRWRRILAVAYSKPLARKWRRDELKVFPTWLFDAFVVSTCALLAAGYFFGIPGVIGTLLLPLFLLMDKKKKSATLAEEQAKESPHRGPVWDAVSNRVKAALWKHAQAKRVRYSVAIYRSYRDDDGNWHNVHFFDAADLPDVILLAKQAQDKIDQLEGIV